MPSNADNTPHAALALDPAEVLIAAITDRLERKVDRMILAGQSTLGILARPQHLNWLYKNVYAIIQLPVMAYIAPPAYPIRSLPDPANNAPFPPKRPNNVPPAAWYELNDPTLPAAVDAVLVADDLYQQACVDAARAVLPPKITISRLYDRLPIGRLPLPQSFNVDANTNVVVRKSTPRDPSKHATSPGTLASTSH